MNTDQSADAVIASCKQAQSERGLPGLEAKRDSGPLFAAKQVSHPFFLLSSVSKVSLLCAKECEIDLNY